MEFRNKKPTTTATIVSGITCLLVISLSNFAFWQQLAVNVPTLVLLAIGLLLATIFYTCLLLVSFKYLYKPLIISMLLVTVISAYAMDYFGFIISAQALQNIFESHGQEISELVSWQLILRLILLFVLPAIIIANIKIEYPRLKTLIIHLTLSIFLIVANIAIFSSEYMLLIRNTRQARYYLNPVRPLYSFAKLLAQKSMYNIPATIIELDAAPTRLKAIKAKMIVLVVGEAARASNQGLNGYLKNTNPRLMQRPVYSFKHVNSCGTETAVSVPCMFSALTREKFTTQKARYTENLLDILQKTQVQILWLDNDGGCKHVCDRVPYQDFTSDGLHDEVLLDRLDRYLQPEYGDKLVVLHLNGNHGPAYHKRYPSQFKKFTPTCETNELQQCSKQEIINTYDNVVLYTDFILDQIINKLEKNSDYDTALIYVSDHGESLGENGIYLHGLPYWLAPKEQIQIPFFIWVSDYFDINRSVLKKRQEQQYSHDNLFHTLLGLFNIQSKVYQADLDMFAAS